MHATTGRWVADNGDSVAIMTIMEDNYMDLAICDPLNQLRPVDWRFLAAQRLARVPTLRPEQVPDLAILLAVAYLRAESEGHHAPAGSEMELLDRAFQIYREDELLRWEIEARVLAGQTDKDLGPRCNLHPGVVGLFTAFFFDVRDRLAAMFLNRLLVLGTDFRETWEKEQVREFWAHQAVVGGLADVEEAVEAFHRARRGRGPATLQVYQRRCVPAELQAKVACFVSRIEELLQGDVESEAESLTGKPKRQRKRASGKGRRLKQDVAAE
jgi:hypothetical protein